VSQTQRFDGLLCAATASLLPLVAWPFAEIGFMDDFSYIRTTQIYAQTGHLLYNGWATAMLGWQILWGALFIKLFGFSFTAPRLSSMVSLFLLVWVFHAVARRCGLNRSSAIFAALLVGISPIAMPLAFSFMTDVNGLLALVLCLYACLRALDATSDRAAFSWLVLAAASNIVGGTARQVAWVGVLALVPATAWYMRSRRGALALGGSLWALGVASIMLMGRWWSHKPGYMTEELLPPGSKMRSLHFLFNFTHAIVLAILCMAFLLFPLLVAWLSRIRLVPRLAQAGFALLSLVYIALCLHRTHRNDFENLVAPWARNVIQDQIYASYHIWMLTDRPVAFPWIRIFISVAVILALLSFTFGVFRFLRSRAPKYTFVSGLAACASSLYRRPALALLVVYTAAYAALLIPRTLHLFIVDRYQFGLLPPLAILILTFHQKFLSPRISGLSVAVLVLFACVGVAGTHDLFAQYRATVQATNLLLQAGIPRTHIDGGEEFDGWTQIETEGYLHDPRIQNVDPYFKVMGKDSTLPEICSFHFLKQTPIVQPEYFAATEKLPCMQASQFGEVAYRSWLPPYQRGVWILQRP